MAAKVTVFPRYLCPSCGVGLVADFPRWGGWALCPSCGSPGRPPSTVRIIAAPPAPALEVMPEELGRPGGLLPPRPPSHPARTRIHRPARVVGTAQWIASTGLFVSAFLLLVSYLDRKGIHMAVFGTLAAAFCVGLIVLRWLSRRGTGDGVGGDGRAAR
ncbi:hypothetical protein [Aquisphaera insulae]|uniref:hypothetical protein n=1 Tax=Aquisphaera insulae TaxID=2712864 RepID=UPI0013EC9FA1|nr:hypothetical protein [Aquisphaera insulae]